jgi:AcrR family transcriptional regulator
MPQIWAESIEQHKRQTTARIIDATVALVAENGLSATSMSHVAESAGIGRATLYSYFPDVEHILLAWHEQEVDRYTQSLSDELARQTDTPSALRVIMTRLIEGFTSGHDHALDASRVELSALSPEIKRQMAGASAKLATLLDEVLEQGIRTGQLRPDLNRQLTATLIMRTASAAREQVEQHQADTNQLTDATLALLLGGIQAPPERTRRPSAPRRRARTSAS